MPARHKAYLFLLVSTIIWGIAGPVIKYTLEYFDATLFLTYRFFLSSLILVPILFIAQPHVIRTLSSLRAKEWIVLSVSSILVSTVQLGLLFWGFTYTTSIDGTVINSTAPILVALAGHYFLRERITRRERIGNLIAFIGTLFLVIEPWLSSGKLFSGNFWGNFLVLVSTLALVAHSVVNKQLLRTRLTPLFLTTAMFVYGFISMSVITILLHDPSSIATQLSSPITGHLGVIYMAVLSGAVAYYFYEVAQKTIEISEANVFLYLSPIFAFPLSVTWLHEELTIPIILGCLIIALGVAVAQLNLKRFRHIF